MKDVLGMQIKIGDFVVYATHSRKKLKMGSGYVIGFTPQMVRINDTSNINILFGASDVKPHLLVVMNML